MVNFTLVFDDIIIKQLKQASKNKQLKNILEIIFDKLEKKGPLSGKLLDSHLFIYEIKNKHPHIRLYFKYDIKTNEIYILEYKIKTSKEEQNKTINKIRFKIKNLKSKIFSGILFTLGNIILEF